MLRQLNHKIDSLIIPKARLYANVKYTFIAGVTWLLGVYLMNFTMKQSALLYHNNILDLKPLRWPSSDYTYAHFDRIGSEGRWYHLLTNVVDLGHSFSYFVFGTLFAISVFYNSLNNICRICIGCITSAWLLDEIENLSLMIMLSTFPYMKWNWLAVLQSLATSVKHVALLGYVGSFAYGMYRLYVGTPTPTTAKKIIQTGRPATQPVSSTG